ncbi:MAG TPA: lytic transglycosylase domain-containing protein [Roseiarcus sp.]|nr:lytic transglycosylase domain-containing protein [Roseiarcus sp.]
MAGAFLPTSVFFAVAIIAGGPPHAPLPLPSPSFGALVPLPKSAPPAPNPTPAGAAPASDSQAPALAGGALQRAGSTIVPIAPDGFQDLIQLADLGARQLDMGSNDVASAGRRGFAWLLTKTPLGGADFSILTAAAALYQKGDAAGGDALAARLDDPLQRLALEWVALRAAPREAGLTRLTSFMDAHPHWPSRGWLVSFREALLYADRNRPDVIGKAFAGAPPATPAGILALATVERDGGHADKAAAMVRDLWRDGDLDGWLEGAILKDFGGLLTKADHRARAIRLLYAEKYGAAARAAALAGGDTPLLANSWVAASRGALSDKALAALPAAVKNAPGLLYARIQGLRRADRALEAAQLMRAAPKDPAALVDGDRWWAERRMIARRLLDGALAKDAYQLCAEPAAVSVAARVDQDFHAGWIALRFLNDPADAARHFAALASLAQTPLTAARAAYWQGRAAEQAAQPEQAKLFYERAAAFSSAYYGQLSAERLDRPLAFHAAVHAAKADARDEATRVVELLYDAKLNVFARVLAIDAAKTYTDESQLAALARVVQRVADAPTAVEIGKQAMLRGFSLDEAAFPTYGVPQFSPLDGSADLPLVYSVARQESEFATAAASGAGAKGVMQLLPQTARDTARRAGIAFDLTRLITDPSFNVQLGAAFLGQLLADEGGSIVLALAAYNAGGGRVQQWIQRYGDPRQPGVDPVDWVERIPFDETRDYVQRVMENWRVYRARFSEAAAASAPPPRSAELPADERFDVN